MKSSPLDAGGDLHAPLLRPSSPRASLPIDVSVIIVNYNTVHLLERMFDALGAARGNLRVEIIVVDNASSDGSVQFLGKRGPDIDLIENKVNVGFGRANNQALARSRGRYVLLLNTDAFVSPDTLSKTVEYMDANVRCGVLGVKLVGSSQTLQPSCRYFPTPWNTFLNSSGLKRYFPHARLVDDMAWDHASVRQCDWVPGCYYLVRREVIDQVGLFDPRYFLYYEEVDHCRAVRNAGWTVSYYPYTKVRHTGGESAQTAGLLTRTGRQISALQIESEILYFRKHHGVAGVLLSSFLTLTGAGMRVAKRMVRPRSIGRNPFEFGQVWTTLKLVGITRFGSRPTR